MLISYPLTSPSILHLSCLTTSTSSCSPMHGSHCVIISPPWSFPHLPCLDSKLLTVTTPFFSPTAFTPFLILCTYMVCSDTRCIFMKPISSDVTGEQVNEFSIMWKLCWFISNFSEAMGSKNTGVDLQPPTGNKGSKCQLD